LTSLAPDAVEAALEMETKLKDVKKKLEDERKRQELELEKTRQRE